MYWTCVGIADNPSNCILKLLGLRYVVALEGIMKPRLHCPTRLAPKESFRKLLERFKYWQDNETGENVCMSQDVTLLSRSLIRFLRAHRKLATILVPLPMFNLLNQSLKSTEKGGRGFNTTNRVS